MAEPADIRMVVFDVDGVLTDGRIILNDHGVETKTFDVRDGFAIVAARRLGLQVAALTGRSSRVVTLRMTELGVDPFIQGSGDKAAGLQAICERAQLQPPQCAFVGDDLFDLPAMLRCGYPIAVADAVAEVRARARYVTTAPGGRGAAREAIEHLLQGRWQQLVERYTV